MEHRWGERTSVDIPVRLRAHGGGIGSGRLSDVSTSGAFIHTWRKLAPLTRIDVMIDAHPVPAFVVRESAGGIGTEWCDLAPDVVSAVPLATRSRRRHMARLDGSWPRRLAERVRTSTYMHLARPGGTITMVQVARIPSRHWCDPRHRPSPSCGPAPFRITGNRCRESFICPVASAGSRPADRPVGPPTVVRVRRMPRRGETRIPIPASRVCHEAVARPAHR